MRQFILFILLSLAIASCSKEEVLSDGEINKFFLQNNDAIMPVQVKGNTLSNIFVIVLHGGPGDSGIKDFGDNGVFKSLEIDYNMVYWDQRCAGLSQGNCNPNTLQVSDYVEDMDKLILLLEDLYGSDISLFLLGHSWGGTLGLDYLISGKNKNKIKGFIQSDGSHSIPMLSIQQKNILLHYANQQIDLGNNVEKWQIILNDVVEADVTKKEDRITILNHTYETEELFTSVDSVNSDFTLTLSFGQFLSGTTIATVNGIINHNFVSDLLDYNIADQLDQITTPIAMYWGKFDLVHPPNMAKDIYGKLGSTDKELYFFRKSFHTPMINENELYQSKVKGFIENFK